MSDKDELSSAWKVAPSEYLAKRPSTYAIGQPTSRYLTMPDGVKLAIDVYLPESPTLKAGTRFPTVAVLTPY